jgi:hypothetical protein
MKYLLGVLFCCGFCFSAESQEQFFKSEIPLSEGQLKEFYAAVAIEGNNIAFIANDWSVYVLDKNTLKTRWSTYLARKTNVPAFVTPQGVLATSRENVVLLDINTGSPMDTIPIDWFETKPIIRNNVLYCTGIYEGGKVFAYDMAEKKMLWSQFVAHGYSVKPYYLNDRIVANAEGNQWITLAYDGKALSCPEKKTEKTELEEDEEEDVIPDEASDEELDISCRETFAILTHDGVKIKEEKLTKLMTKDTDGIGQVLHTSDYTLALDSEGTHILVLGKKGKKIGLLDLTKMSAQEVIEGSKTEMLKIQNNVLWIFYNDLVIAYDFVKKAIVQNTDLSAWEPHQVIVDDKNFWLVSKKDGQLYGIR